MNGRWTTIQRRMDGSVDFQRGWGDYVHGFGNPRGEYWLGLENIHCLTTRHQRCTLRVDMTDFNGVSKYAQYSFFMVGNSASNYTLEISGYSGTAGDSMTASDNLQSLDGMQFSTYDRDNDKWSSNCAEYFDAGGWWFNSCFHGALNGVYRHNTPAIQWHTFTNKLKYADMKLYC